MKSNPNTRDLFRLDGLTAVVTGGLGRLGSRYAEALSTAGASVALFDVASHPSTVVQSLIDSGLPVTTHVVNTTDRAAVDAAVADVTARLGAPSILINNAGLGS